MPYDARGLKPTSIKCGQRIATGLALTEKLLQLAVRQSLQTGTLELGSMAVIDGEDHHGLTGGVHKDLLNF